MTGPLQAWRPEDFDDGCETCGAPPGQLCKPTCDTGYTAEDFRRDQAAAAPSSTEHPVSRPKE
ncbi:hypothetical protein [Streptomyces sp. NPDC059909]|uniref:hypothetical protein n=1 Tax=Streptomyces sp. NPDC059909 TaxID=3346998 RepID=UPI003664AFDE